MTGPRAIRAARRALRTGFCVSRPDGLLPGVRFRDAECAIRKRRIGRECGCALPFAKLVLVGNRGYCRGALGYGFRIDEHGGQIGGAVTAQLAPPSPGFRFGWNTLPSSWLRPCFAGRSRVAGGGSYLPPGRNRQAPVPTSSQSRFPRTGSPSCQTLALRVQAARGCGEGLPRARPQVTMFF